MSATHWTLLSELVVAEPLSNDVLRSLGLQIDQLDDLLSAHELRAMSLDQLKR